MGSTFTTPRPDYIPDRGRLWEKINAFINPLDIALMTASEKALRFPPFRLMLILSKSRYLSPIHTSSVRELR
jgi:hypothetical protein